MIFFLYLKFLINFNFIISLSPKSIYSSLNIKLKPYNDFLNNFYLKITKTLVNTVKITTTRKCNYSNNNNNNAASKRERERERY